MDNEKQIAKLKEKDYQKYFGVTKETFAIMYKILDEKYQEEHKWGGRPSVLSVLDKLVIFLQYYREYRTMEHIAFDYNTNKSTVCDAIHWAEETLIKNTVFHLPPRKKVINGEPIKKAAVDVTETEIERPQKNKRDTTQARKEGTH
ncbi:MAG: transposase family protein [Oscillospiraceae bacterium]|nr:transposase family protein [Oscillospiraceae bacterium]